MSKKPLPTVDRLREVLRYEPETGRLIRLVSRSNRVKVGDEIGSARDAAEYRAVIVDGTRILAHRVAWAMHYGSWPVGEVDHRNGVRSDNRIDNLRDVTQSVNQQNLRKAKSHNSTGYLGVSFHKASLRYHARIRVGGKVHSLRYHATPELAYAAYLKAKREIHEGNTL